MADSKNYAAELGKSLFEELKRQFGGEWDGVSTADRILFERVANDAAIVQLEAALRPPGAMSDELLAEKRHVNAQLANLDSIAVSSAQRIFWSAVKSVMQRMVGLAFAAVV